MPTSCKDLESMGQKISGIFLVKGLRKIDAVFVTLIPKLIMVTMNTNFSVTIHLNSNF